MGKTIDLRSDTVTRPDAAMRRAMAESEVGDDVFGEDPTINKLQRRAAEIFGREAGLYVPSGTMSNLVAIWSQTQPGQEVICEAQSHIYNYENASISAIAGVLPRVVQGRDGVMDWASIEAAISPKVYYRAQTALICLENTHNRAGGAVFPTVQAHEICDRAHKLGIPVHLDGARIFNAAAALGEDVAEMTRPFDSISFCFSKGLGAPVGSMVLGSKALIDRARSLRKMLGGGMRQAGVLAAAALVALEESPKRLHEDHANARFLAEALAEMPGFGIDLAGVATNIVIFDIAGTEMDAMTFLGRLAGERVLAVPVGRTEIRMVTHRDVSRSDIEMAVEALRRIVAK